MQLLELNQRYGMEVFGNPASGLWGLILMSKGQMTKGFRMLREATQICRENGCLYDTATMELCQGKVYARMVTGAAPVNPSLLIKNIGFILINLPFAGRRAEEHFNKAAQILRRTDSASALGNVYLEPGCFYQKKGKKSISQRKSKQSNTAIPTK